MDTGNAVHTAQRNTGREAIRAVLDRRRPDRIVYAPNYWQWLSHHRQHGMLPDAISHCETQLQLLHHLGVDVFSRNLYCDQRRCWFGGLSDIEWDGVEVDESEHIVAIACARTRTGSSSRPVATRQSPLGGSNWSGSAMPGASTGCWAETSRICFNADLFNLLHPMTGIRT